MANNVAVFIASLLMPTNSITTVYRCNTTSFGVSHSIILRLMIYVWVGLATKQFIANLINVQQLHQSFRKRKTVRVPNVKVFPTKIKLLTT